MEDIIFSSQEELYMRIKPALRSKKKLLYQNGYKNIKENDIWDYMRTQKWSNSYGLELSDMVDDILNTDNKDIDAYCHDKYMPKEPNLDEIELPKFKTE